MVYTLKERKHPPGCSHCVKFAEAYLKSNAVLMEVTA